MASIEEICKSVIEAKVKFSEVAKNRCCSPPPALDLSYFSLASEHAVQMAKVILVMREALRFYSAEENHNMQVTYECGDGCCTEYGYSKYTNDNGDTAEKALQQAEEIMSGGK